MKILILADIHSNFEALRAVFKYVKNENLKIHQYFILGDIIGYGPFPNECVDLIRSIPNCRSIAGNHEHAITDKISVMCFSINAKESVTWTKKRLTKVNYNYLDSLPAFEKIKEDSEYYLLVHGSPRSPIEEYITDNYIAKQSFLKINFHVCFFSHTHIPINYIYSDNNIAHVDLADNMVIKLRDDYRYLINVGSIGQPRDGDPRAGFGILDTDKRTILIKRIEYNYQKTQHFVIKYGLPKALARRLSYGR